MARMAVADGIRVLAATPHSPASTASRKYSPALVRERADQLIAALAAEDVPLEIVVGTEITFVADVVEQLRRGELLTYGGGRAILLEPPFSGLPHGFDTVIFALQLAGYRVVLAHPERLPDVQEDPDLLIPLIERGVLIQITAQALTGGQGDYLRSVAETLLLHRMVHVLASDAHGVPPRRPPVLTEARERAAELLGAEAAAALVEETPRALLEGRRVAVSPPRPVRRRR
nr:MAG: protein-tyrosine-phosphatase [Chloroflexota bacterium]